MTVLAILIAAVMTTATQAQPGPMATPPGWMPATLQAEALVKEGRFLEAATIYEKYSATQPWFPAAHYLRADALLRAGKLDEVRAVLAAARKNVPRTAPMRSEAAVFATALVDAPAKLSAADVKWLLSEAHALADEALKMDPKSPDALRAKANILLSEATRLETDPARKKKLEAEAEALFMKAIGG